ncbi:MAG: hypothetical protein ACWGOX_12485, partial [Desulforhopalus sp.]
MQESLDEKRGLREREGKMTSSGNQCKKSDRTWWLFALFFAVLTTPGSLLAETVKMPMTIDFSLLRELIVRQAYPEPDERVAIMETENGCNEIWLGAPRIGEENGEVRFQTDISIVWGTPLGSKCLVPIRWAGSIVFWQQPQVDGGWRLKFVTRDSSLLNQQGEQPAIPKIIWNQVKKYVHGYIDSLVIDLSPPVDNLKQLMAPPDRGPELSAAEIFLATMRPDQPEVKRYGLTMNILADYDATPPGEEDEIDVLFEKKPETREQIQSLWQTWDALLVNMVNQLSAIELTGEERLLILDTLLTMRYDFSEVIGGSGLTTNFVRRQFIASWLALKPLFERRLTSGPPDSLLGYLSFFTAADALVVLDRIEQLLDRALGADNVEHLDRRTPGVFRLVLERRNQELHGVGVVGIDQHVDGLVLDVDVSVQQGLRDFLDVDVLAARRQRTQRGAPDHLVRIPELHLERLV